MDGPCRWEAARCFWARGDSRRALTFAEVAARTSHEFLRELDAVMDSSAYRMLKSSKAQDASTLNLSVACMRRYLCKVLWRTGEWLASARWLPQDSIRQRYLDPAVRIGEACEYLRPKAKLATFLDSLIQVSVAYLFVMYVPAVVLVFALMSL